jgi:hypothetical protein
MHASATLAAVDPLRVVAAVLLVLAAAAVAMLVRGAVRTPGGVRRLFSLRGDEPQGEGGGVSPADELRELMAQARALADELAADLDGRAERVEALLARLESHAAALETGTNGAVPRVRGSVGAIETKPHAARLASASPHTSSPMTEYTGHGPPELDPMTREIYRLSDGGLPPVEIAQRLSQHTGKVELILALRAR